MSIEDAVKILKENGYMIGQGSDGYWHYCNDTEESLYAGDNEIKDLALRICVENDWFEKAFSRLIEKFGYTLEKLEDDAEDKKDYDWPSCGLGGGNS